MNVFDELAAEIVETELMIADVRDELARVERVQAALHAAGPGHFAHIHALATEGYAMVADSLRRCAATLEAPLRGAVGEGT